MSDAASLSTQAAQIIFGALYPDYISWQQNIADPEQSQYYSSRHDWRAAVRSLRCIPLGATPDKCHFKTFMDWLWLNDKLYPRADKLPVSTLTVASECGHLLHPGNPRQDMSYCPICTINQCVLSLRRIEAAWTLVWGGPIVEKIAPKKRAPLDLYVKIKKFWQVEKLRFANLVYRYEQLADGEQQWEKEQLYFSKHTFDDLTSAKSCVGALKIAREQCPYMAVGAHVPFVKGKRFSSVTALEKIRRTEDEAEPFSSHSTPTVGPASPNAPISLLELPLPDFALQAPSSPSPSEARLSPSLSSASSSEFRSFPPTSPARTESLPRCSTVDAEQDKHVTFASDRTEYEHRPRRRWRRASPSYIPGRHASPPGYEWDDTSFMNMAEECFYELPIFFSISIDEISVLEVSSSTDVVLAADSDSDSDDSDTDSTSSVATLAESDMDASSTRPNPLAMQAIPLLENKEPSRPAYKDSHGEKAPRSSKDTAIPTTTSPAQTKPEAPKQSSTEKKHSSPQADQNGAGNPPPSSCLGRRSRDRFDRNANLASTDRNPAEIKRLRLQNEDASPSKVGFEWLPRITTDQRM